MLVPIGTALFMLSIIGGILGHRCALAVAGTVPRALVGITLDLFRACFFVGPGCYIIGRLRNTRWREEHERNTNPSQTPPVDDP